MKYRFERLTVSGAGVGLTTTEMMDPYMLGLNGFANDPNWVLDAGRDYPRLAWEGTVGQSIPVVDLRETYFGPMSQFSSCWERYRIFLYQAIEH